MIQLENNNLDDFIKEGKSLVDFYAQWCGPCKMLAPVLEKFENDIKIIKVDVDKLPDLAMKYRVMSIPTLIFFNDGEVKEEVVGFRDYEEIKNIIDNL